MSIRKIGKIRKFLDKATTERLIHAFVTSRLVGLPATELNKLQRIQNIAARLVTLTKRTDHITPILNSLHWLPVRKRIIFKILLLTFKVIRGLAPAYLTDLLHFYTPSRALRSSSKQLLKMPIARTSTYGERSFSFAAPKLWNDLPIHIKNSETLNIFKTTLKTHIFKS